MHKKLSSTNRIGNADRVYNGNWMDLLMIARKTWYATSVRGTDNMLRRSVRMTVAGLIVVLSLSAVGWTRAKHPYILWDRDDIANLKTMIETQPWAARACEQLKIEPKRHEEAFAELLRCVVEPDDKRVGRQIEELLRTARSPVPRGAAQYINVIRYDLFYDRLAPDQRREVEQFFRTYIDNIVFKRAIFDPDIFNDSRNYSRYDARVYTRSNWLPNITWPWKVSANLMAAALGDKQLIRKVWDAYGSWRWYFDEYLCDIGFYAEEFSKMGSTPGAMLIYCRAVERLGLNELGFGYTGKGGATMKGHIESLIHITYPRIDLESSRPQYPLVTMGDLRQSGSSQSWDLPSPAFQHSLVMGYTPDGQGGNVFWKAHGAWGGTRRGDHAQWDGYSNFTPKMQIPLWFEIGHARWPDVGFDYFLARMRAPDQHKYYPSLYFGLDPIDPADADPPAAPSAVWPDRGMVMLRADQSPSYWQSPAPAVSMRLAANYAHNVRDCLALMGFYAFNRPIYLNRQVTPGYARNWSRSIQSHCAVTVDGREPEFTDKLRTRHAFTDPVKFVEATSDAVYPDVKISRKLMLTREYLLDVTHLDSPEPHQYFWFIHTLGQLDQHQDTQWRKAELPGELIPLDDVRAFEAGDADWQVAALQTCTLDDPARARLPKQWYDRKVGVRMTMLGEADTTAYVAQTPLPIIKQRNDQGDRILKEVPSEVGGVTLVVARNAERTTFAALHEPFEHARPKIADFRLIGKTDNALVVAVQGAEDSPVSDRLMIRLAGDPDQPTTISNGREQYTFTGWGYVRIGLRSVQAHGDIRLARFAVSGSPDVALNGRSCSADVSDGIMTVNGSRR